MKTLKSLLPFLLAVFALAGCKTDDLEKDIDALTDRVTSLETQVSLLNENLNALRVFADGGKTITEVLSSGTAPNITYTLTLSDGSTLTLTQGSVGTTTTPEITIEDGIWVINGVPTSEKAVGDNGLTPQFRINSKTYNWEVNFTGELDGWQEVKDENGNPVKATTDQSIQAGDQFFTAVEETVENGVTVLKVTLATGQTYSLPIVEDLLCQIVDPSAEEGFSNGVWTIGYGETVKAAVKVKGENYIVNAPEGWIATVEVTNAETGEGTLTVTAPAQTVTQSRAAVADNTTDLVLQVNKGITWAVDKIQVKAERVINSYYDVFMAGESLDFGGFALNSSDYEAGENFVIAHITSESESKAITTQGIYFVDPGVEVTWEYTGAVANMFIIGDNPRSKTSVLSFPGANYVRLNSGSATEGAFICANMTINARTENYSINSNNQIGNVIFDGCIINTSTKAFYYTSGDNKGIGNLVFANSIVNLTGFTTQFFNATTFKDISVRLENNVFYAKEVTQTRQLINAQASESGSAIIKNNTFINLAAGTYGIVNAKTLNTVDMQNNLFYLSSYSAYQIAVRVTDDNNAIPAGLTATVYNNFCNAEQGVVTQTWKAFMSNEVGEGNQQITRGKQAMFETLDFENQLFVPIAEYAAYGAQQ